MQPQCAYSLIDTVSAASTTFGTLFHVPIAGRRRYTVQIVFVLFPFDNFSPGFVLNLSNDRKE
jgi:hypothetical protein